jgi:hypothetical protein
MKKSLRVLIGTLILGLVVTASGFCHVPNSDGADPVPLCPPGGCVIR